jgi:hypothetical protein
MKDQLFRRTLQHYLGARLCAKKEVLRVQQAFPSAPKFLRLLLTVVNENFLVEFGQSPSSDRAYKFPLLTRLRGSLLVRNGFQRWARKRLLLATPTTPVPEGRIYETFGGNASSDDHWCGVRQLDSEEVIYCHCAVSDAGWHRHVERGRNICRCPTHASRPQIWYVRFGSVSCRSEI